jgi:hypothetical protein
LWRRSGRETACPTHGSRAPTRVGPEALGGEGALAEAREVPRTSPEVERQRKPAEGWRDEGPKCPRTAWATSGWCQSTGCRRMAIGSHPVNGLDRPSCHRVHSCDHGRDHDRDPPEPVGCRRAPCGGGPECGEEDPPGGRGESPRSAVERRGRSGGRSGGEAKLFEKQIVLGLRKGGKRFHAGEDVTIEARAQATEEVEHEALVGDGGPESVKSVCHRLHLTTVLIHREIALRKLTEGGLEVQNPSLAVVEELSLKGTPDPVSSVVRYVNDVLKFGREGAMNPG